MTSRNSSAYEASPVERYNLNKASPDWVQKPGAPCLFCVLAHTAPVRFAPNFARGVFSRQAVRERDSPGGTQVCQVGRLFQILFLTGYFIQCHQGSQQSNCRLRIRILQDITATTGSKTDQCETIIVIFCRFTSDLQIIRIIIIAGGQCRPATAMAPLVVL